MYVCSLDLLNLVYLVTLPNERAGLIADTDTDTLLPNPHGRCRETSFAFGGCLERVERRGVERARQDRV